MSKPTVLVIGGTGFIGKNLVAYLVDYELASRVRVVDKCLPMMAHMDARFEAVFQKPEVEFVQCDMLTAKGVEKGFNGERYNVVINLAGITQFGRFEAEYELMEQMKVKCAGAAAELGCDKYIEVSTCAVYNTKDKGEKPAKEDSPTDPHHIIAKAHLAAEKAILSNFPDLPVVIVRLPHVYGPADTSGLLPRLTCAASYVGQEDNKMTNLYSSSLRIHTLHVQDAVGGIWFLACAGANREIYNLVDKNDTTQEKLNEILETIFPIKTECLGHNKTKAVMMIEKLDDLVETANDDHTHAWSTLLAEHDLETGPLTTHLAKEQLSGRPISASGDKAEQLGYAYSVPTVTADYIRHALQYWIDRKHFPPVMQ